MPRRFFSRKTLIRTGIVLAVLAVIGGLVYRYFREEERKARAAWESYRAAAEKRGVKLFMRDFLPPDVVEAENYAAIPLIHAMFDERKPGAEPDASFSFPKGEKQPKLTSFANGEGTDLGAWRAYLVGCKLLATTTEDVAGDILRGLEKFDPHLQQLRDASSRPWCKFPTRWESGMDVKMPHLSPLSRAAKIFALRMEALLTNGDNASALSEFCHGMRLSEALASEPTIVPALLRWNMMSNLKGAVWYGLAAHRWTEADLVVIEKVFAGIRLHDEFEAAFESERGTVPEWVLDLTAKSSREILRALEGLPNSEADSSSKLVIGFWSFAIRGVLYENVRAMHEGIDATLASYKAMHNGSAIMSSHFSVTSWIASRSVETGKPVNY